MLKNTELRKLPAGFLCSIAAILDTNDDWKKVMSFIPRNPRNDYFEPRYNNDHIKQIEDYARTSNRKCADILFEEWGTTGRIRPTLGTLKDVVQKAEIFRAADELAEMLQEAPPERPKDGPAAPVDTSNITYWLQDSSEQQLHGTTAQVKSESIGQNVASLGNKTTAQVKSDLRDPSMNIPNLTEMLGNSGTQPKSDPNSLPNIDFSSSGIATDILRDDKLIHFQYRELELISNRFSEKLIYTPDAVQGVQGRLAGKIGNGGFGDVYVGYHPHHGHLAIKKARNHATFDRRPDIAIKLFNAEVRFLSQFRHKNIVPIIGFSGDGLTLCVVCEYIDGGSLEQKLAAKILNEEQRMNIMIGTAEGLRYLHGSEKPSHDPELLYRIIQSDSKKNNFVHGDVKTANILLTRDYVPKLCDFGLAKQYESTYITSRPMGTSAYMAPEGFSGTITQKIDIYSYGIVLLEILTGLKPIVINNDREKINIKNYIEESCSNNEISNLLDPFVGKWTNAKEIYALAKSCLEIDRKRRPTSEEICTSLYRIYGIEREM